MKNRQVEAEAKYPKGTVVQVDQTRLDEWQSDVSAKLKNRFGRVTSYGYPSGDPIVVFEAVGRRTEFRKSFSLDSSGLVIVTDEKVIAEYDEAVAKKKAAASKSSIR